MYTHYRSATHIKAQILVLIDVRRNSYVVYNHGNIFF